MGSSARSFHVRDKVVWLTGASSGIGEALAIELAARGARLIISSRDEAALERVRVLCAGGGDNVRVLRLDLSVADELEGKAAQAIGMFGHVDVLVHNAGVVARDMAQDIDPGIDRRIMETNYFGPVSLTKAVLPHMLARGCGQLVVISSLSGKYGVPKLSAYAASKHALHGFFESLRAEVHHRGVRISMVIPGFINTPLVRNGMDGKGVPRTRDIGVNERGMPPQRCARGIVRVMERARPEALVGGMETWSVLLHRLFPNVSRMLIRNNPVRRLRSLGVGGR